MYRLISLLFLWTLSGCSYYGTTHLPSNRVKYNEALQRSDLQQNLLNTVRLRYNDNPYFLNVNSVISQFSFTKELGGEIGNTEFSTRLLGKLAGSASVTETPTMTFTPYQGEDYVTKLLTPIRLEAIYMLLRAGWSLHHVLSLCVQKLGPYENAILASRSVTGRIPIYKDFHTISWAFHRLEERRAIEYEGTKVDKQFAIKFHILSFAGLSAQDLRLFRQVGVTPQSPYFWFTTVRTSQKNEMFAESRTISELLYYLSKGVRVPPEDMNTHAPMLVLPNKQYFDWRAIVGGIFDVYSSKTAPANAYVAIRYKGHWFYLKDDDFNSKETMMLLSMITGIYQGKVQSFLPVFTVS
ncbi:MAG: hypothetical protein Q8R83_03590 [Legionellaceae bacterium]|nr:hypothetical protein [Legionellaceae bacterium]